VSPATSRSVCRRRSLTRQARLWCLKSRSSS
jgi:hypothetical protein